MRLLKLLSYISLFLIAVGLTNSGDTSASDNNFGKIVLSKNTEIPVTKVELEDLGTMKASWYGKEFHGKTTANGEIFDQSALTAAHKSLPFGTILQITNPKNHKTIFVRINDRGPFVFGRDLDLSKASAKALGILHNGVVRVKVQEVKINSDEGGVTSLN